MKSHDSNHYEIALIGYTGAGKTVLAAGLYATSTEDFTVSAKDDDTAKRLEASKAELDAGKWPDATKSFEDMHIENKRRGKEPVVIDFKEYMGESAYNSDAFKRDVVGNPRGALILLNPKMDILRDSGKRNKMISQIKGFIDYLSEPDKRCSHIAFVVTASDLLTTSYRDYRDEFDGYKREITNSLNTSPKFQDAWKEFEVTVTGPLEDPEHPRIAKSSENTARLPFEWLVEQFEEEDSERKSGNAIRKWVVRGVAVAILLMCGFASWYFYLDRTVERKLGACADEHGEAVKQALTVENLQKIGEHCDAMEAALLDVETNKSFFAGEPFFDDNKARYSTAWTNLVRLVETGRSQWFPKEIADLERRVNSEYAKAPKEELVDAENNFGVEWKTLQTDAHRVCTLVTESGSNDLNRIIRKDQPQIDALLRKVDQHNKGVKDLEIARHDTEAETNATEAVCGAWRKSIADWNPATDEGLAMRSNLLAQIDGPGGEERKGKKYEWRQKYERRQFVDAAERFLTGLQNLIVSLNLDKGVEINESLRECNKYARWAQNEDSRPEVDLEVRTNYWKRIQGEEDNLLTRLRKLLVEELKSDKSEPPKVAEDVWQSVRKSLCLNQALSEDEFDKWEKGLNGEVEKVYAEWATNQNKKCADFIKTKIAGVSGLESFNKAVTEYKDFCSTECPNAPDLLMVAEAVSGIVMNEFRKIYEKTKDYAMDGQITLINKEEQAMNDWQEKMKSRYKVLEEAHGALRRLVNAVAGPRMLGSAKKHIKKTAAHEFAAECMKKMSGTSKESFAQQYEITQIDATPRDKSGLLNKEYKEVRTKISQVVYDDNEDKGKSFSFPLLIDCELLTHDDKDKTKAIWKKTKTPVMIAGTPWFPAMIVFDSVGGRFDWNNGRTRTIIPFVNGSDFENGRGYVDGSFKMNNDVTVYVRVHVRPSGTNFLSFAEHYLFHEGK